MRRSPALLVPAAVLVAAYLAASDGMRDGPMLKLLQLCTLVPAVLLAAWTLSGWIRGDLGLAFSRMLSRPSSALFVAVLAAWIFAFASWTALVPLEGIPRGGDETAYLFQSRILERGRLWAPAPPVTDPGRFFPFRHLILDEGRWFTMYTPLHALLMAPFTSAGLHSLMGPLEGALSIAGTFLLLSLLTGGIAARKASLLMAASPFFLLMSATRMAHNTTLMFVVYGALLVTVAVRRRKPVLCVPGGFLLGLAVNAKPYPDIAWIPFVLLALWFHGRPGRLRFMALTAAGAMPAAVLLLLTNAAYTGDPFTAAYNLARGGSLLGFGPDKAWFPEYGDHAHTPLRGLVNLARQAGAASNSLLGWPLISLVPALWALVHRRRAPERLWGWGLAAGFAFLLWFHYSASVDYGPRHYYTLLPVMCALSAAGLGEMAGAARRRLGERGGSFVALATAGLFSLSALFYLPSQIGLRAGRWMAVDREPADLAREICTVPALIFMQASEHGYPNIVSGLNFTSPFLDGELVFCAHQEPEEDLELMTALPGRNPYLYWFDGMDGHMEEWTFETASRLAPVRSIGAPGDAFLEEDVR